MIGDKAYDYSVGRAKKLAKVKKSAGLFEGDIVGFDIDAVDEASHDEAYLLWILASAI